MNCHSCIGRCIEAGRKRDYAVSSIKFKIVRKNRFTLSFLQEINIISITVEKHIAVITACICIVYRKRLIGINTVKRVNGYFCIVKMNKSLRRKVKGKSRKANDKSKKIKLKTNKLKQ